MTPSTKQEAQAYAAAIRDEEKWPNSSLANMAMLYQNRGGTILGGIIRAEMRRRQMESGRLPLGEATLFDEEV